MLYTFQCSCGWEDDLAQEINDDHTPPACPRCGVKTRRIYNNQTRGDELRSTKYVDEKGNQINNGHGYRFDIGMGAGYSTWSERERLVKEKGLREYGPEQRSLPPPPRGITREDLLARKREVLRIPNNPL